MIAQIVESPQSSFVPSGAASTIVEPTTFGVFRLGSMLLALPLEALREVLPSRGIQPLPTRCPHVRGMLDMRGTPLPVLDLAALFGVPAGESEVVVVLAHEGRLLGLLADRVVDVVDVPGSDVVALGVTGGEASLASGGFPVRGHGGLALVLSPHALAELDDVAWADDRMGVARDVASSELRTTVLVQCRDLLFAIDADMVHTTVLNVAERTSPMTGDYCVGTVVFGDRAIAAVDLARLCGIAPEASGGCPHALVVEYPAGPIAFRISAIVDVARVPTAGLVAVPPGFARDGLIDGLIPVDDAGSENARRFASRSFFAHLSSDALHAHAGLVAFAGLSTPVAGSSAVASEDPRETLRILRFEAGFEIAAPIEQVVEILEVDPRQMVRSSVDPRLRVYLSREKSFLVHDLATVLGQPAPPPGSDDRVLVVAAGTGAVGFVVSRLVSIEPGVVLSKRDSSRSSAGELWGDFSMVRVGSDGAQRQIGLLDLTALATRLLAVGPPPSPELDWSGPPST